MTMLADMITFSPDIIDLFGNISPGILHNFVRQNDLTSSVITEYKIIKKYCQVAW